VGAGRRAGTDTSTRRVGSTQRGVLPISALPLPAGDIRHLVKARIGAETVPEALVRQVAERLKAILPSPRRS
jgi:hypothetical protein